MKEALKLALEAFEKLNSTNGYWWQEVDEETLAKIDPAITAIKAALAQPKQEPVGYIDAETLRRWDSLKGTDYECDEKCYMPFSRKAPHKSDIVDCSLPVYTTPPQPEERNFCPRCGKRTADLTVIHTCTPPQERT